MIKIDRNHSMQGLLAATALPLGLLASGSIPVYAGVVSVTGAYGASGSCGNPGGTGGGATAATTTLGDGSNTATAQGGHGGPGSNQLLSCLLPSKAGGPGGLATATTNIKAGSASATANATGGGGGLGGRGKVVMFQHAVGGAGGAATATSSATDAGAGAVTSSATAHGGDGGSTAGLNAIITGAGGMAKAVASGQSTGGGTVDVSASASGGAGNGGGGAFGQSTAKNSSGEALAIASAPGGGAVSAVSNFAVGSGPEPPAAIMAGWVVSDAKRTPGGSVIGYGAMSAGSGESGAATAVFDFSATVPEALDLNLLSDSFLGTSDTVELQVVVGGQTTKYDFSNSTFPKQLPLGAIAAGNQTVSLSFDLKGGNGFGFTYDFADPKALSPQALIAGIPEPSTWAMMLVGFAGLACAGYRASRNAVAGAA